jgi:hypothetical protein
MTLAEIESVLSERGLRLRAVREGKTRRWTVEVADPATNSSFEATGTSLKDAVQNAVEAAEKRPVRRRNHRYKS